MKVLEKYGLKPETRANPLCLTSLILMLDENIQALEKANNSLIESLKEIKLMQEDILGEQCAFSGAWIIANEALNDQ